MDFKTFFGRLLQGDIRHQAIARGMISVAGFLFLSKLAGAAKEMAVAYRFGISAEVDAYVLVLTIVSWPTATFLADCAEKCSTMATCSAIWDLVQITDSAGILR